MKRPLDLSSGNHDTHRNLKSRQEIRAQPQTISQEPLKSAPLDDEFLIKLYSDTLEKPLQYDGNGLISDLFALYLARTYGTKCIFQVSGKPVSLDLLFQREGWKIVGTTPERTIENVRKSFAECVAKKPEMIVLGLNIWIPGWFEISHANMLIFRTATRTFEHFEPHGRAILMSDSTEAAIEAHLLDVLQKVYPHPFHFVPASEVCPANFGVQTYESMRRSDEGFGYCVAWSLFFAEMCLRNPQLDSSAKVYDSIQEFLNKYSFREKTKVTQKIIRSYVKRMGKVLFDYYSLVLEESGGFYLKEGERVTPETIIHFLTGSGKSLTRLIEAVQLIVHMELDWLNSRDRAGKEEYELLEGEELQKKMESFRKDVNMLLDIDDVPPSAKYALRPGEKKQIPVPNPELQKALHQKEESLVRSQQQLRAASKFPERVLRNKIAEYQNPTTWQRMTENVTEKLRDYESQLSAVQAAQQQLALHKAEVQSAEKQIADSLLYQKQHTKPPESTDSGSRMQQSHFLDPSLIRNAQTIYHSNFVANPQAYGGRKRNFTRRR